MLTRKFRSIPAVGLVMLFSIMAPANLPAENASKGPATVVPDLLTLSSADVVRRMGLGWNLGNTMEACGDWIKGGAVHNYETAWGNPDTTKEMIDAIKKAGFNSIRVPVAWSNMIGADYTIDPTLTARVKQIVDWALADGLIVVVNIHWDGGWWSKFPTETDQSMKRYTKMWAQIAKTFKDYPGTLILESLNEEGCWNDLWNRWGGAEPEKKKKAFGILNDINQAFVDLVRKSGGMNAKRHLLIAGYATDIDQTVDPMFLMPKDPANHCVVSVHYYTPFTFAGLEKDESWGKVRTTWGTDADIKELNDNMEKLRLRFIDQGIPVIMGEYGATLKNRDLESVRHYMLAIAEKDYLMGICPMLWDNGTHFNRRSLAFNDQDLLKGFWKIINMRREEPAKAAAPAGK